MAAAICLRFSAFDAYAVASTIARVSAAKLFGELVMNSRLAAKLQQGWPSQISLDRMCMKPTPS